MGDKDRDELTWAIWRVCERDGEEFALRLLDLVGLAYGASEQESMTHAVRTYRDEMAAWG